MESRIKGQISVHVSLILFLIDDYTGKRISSSAVQIRVEGAEKPIYKKEGYYIFTNLQKKEVMVSIQAPEYQTVKRLIDLQELEGGEPLVKIRLQPGRCYSLLNEMTVLTGKTEPFFFFLAASVQSGYFYRLLYDYKKEKENQIHIFNLAKADLEAKSFLIWQRDVGEYEFFDIGKALEKEGEVFEVEALKKEYKKAATKIFPVFLGQADEEGSFFLAMGNLEGEEAEVILEVVTGKEKREMMRKVRVGKENILTLF